MNEQHSQSPPQDSQPIIAENMTPSSQIAAALQREHPEWVSEIIDALSETTLIVPREQIVSVCQFVKSAPGLGFDFLADLCGFDRGPEEEPRFEVNYHLFSTKKHHRIIWKGAGTRPPWCV